MFSASCVAAVLLRCTGLAGQECLPVFFQSNAAAIACLRRTVQATDDCHSVSTIEMTITGNTATIRV